MRAKPLWQLSVAISAEAEEAVVEMLTGIFANPPSIYTDADTRATMATVYCERADECDETTLSAVRAGLENIASCGLDVGPAKISVQPVRREDWAESWKRHFKPIRVGQFLLVRPSWSKRKAEPGQAVVTLDPGLSFGTGQHPTTGFCLRQLTRGHDRKAARSFLDIGTGSGILAIAAAKLGYRPVQAFDFDPAAVRVARANAKTNGVAGKIRIQRQDLTQLPMRSRQRYDVVCANLIFDLLVQERERILNRLAPDGRLILAGILASQFPAVESAYGEKGMRLIASRTEKEWRSGTFIFNS